MELFLEIFVESVVVLDHVGEVLAHNNSLFVCLDLIESGSHDGKHHVEQNEHVDQGANKEDDVEDPQVLCRGVSVVVWAEILRNLKVTQGKPVGVDDADEEATNAFVIP